ncbi:MAG: sigma-70 family RNA polymerase sigma factor [Proteobacteria bacterium]|nr:sigma-70 family RNA polymerase sigma factor [Pseudomonadota bacterium]
MTERNFEKKAAHFLKDIYRFLYHLCEDPQTAEDLTQETFLRAFRYRSSYNPDFSLKSWLLKIAHNLYRDWLKKSSLRFSIEDPESIPKEVSTPAFEERLMERIPDREVLRAITSLPDEFREVVLLRDVEGMSYQEIAQTMECPVGTVRSRIFRAREAIDKKIRPLLD